jgi:hypothetical protein
MNNANSPIKGSRNVLSFHASSPMEDLGHHSIFTPKKNSFLHSNELNSGATPKTPYFDITDTPFRHNSKH